MHIELREASLQFGSVRALHNVSMSIGDAEVVCLLGDNGAGKSSLIRVLSGVHQPTAGRLFINGDAVHLASPRASLDRGIATVHQDLALVPMLPVWRNFYLGAEPVRGRGPFRRIDVAAARAGVTTALAEFGISLRDPDTPMARLSGGERQSVAIARALQRGARLLILDEPTAALGVKQAEIVLRTIAAAREKGTGVLFVTHNPQHAFRVGDRFVVLQQGAVIGEFLKAETSAERLAELMV